MHVCMSACALPCILLLTVKLLCCACMSGEHAYHAMYHRRALIRSALRSASSWQLKHSWGHLRALLTHIRVSCHRTCTGERSVFTFRARPRRQRKQRRRRRGAAFRCKVRRPVHAGTDCAHFCVGGCPAAALATCVATVVCGTAPPLLLLLLLLLHEDAVSAAPVPTADTTLTAATARPPAITRPSASTITPAPATTTAPTPVTRSVIAMRLRRRGRRQSPARDRRAGCI